MILRGVSFSILKFNNLIENNTKFENILTHWSVAQAGSSDEKNRGRKSRWTVPLSVNIDEEVADLQIVEAGGLGSILSKLQVKRGQPRK